MSYVNLFHAWRAEYLKARRAVRLAYSRTSATDDLKAPPALAAAHPVTFLRNVSSIIELIADHAENAIPAMFGTDPNRAMIAWQTFYRFNTADETGPNDIRTYRKVLSSLDVRGVLTVDEWESAPLIAELLDGEIRAEATATSSEPKVLTTTKGHQAKQDGTYATYRAHMPVWDSRGNVGDAHELTDNADDLFRLFSSDGELGEFALLGTQDLAPGNNAPATSDYKSDGALRKATPASHGTESYGPDNAYNERGQMTYRGGNGRTPNTVGGIKRPTVRSFKYGKDKKTGEVKAPRCMVETDISGCFEARLHHAYATYFDGVKFVGWAKIERTKASKARPTTRKARALRVKQTETIDAARAPYRCAERAMALYNAHVTPTKDTQSDATTTPIPQRFTIKTDSGITIAVGLKQGKTRPSGFAISITTADKKRWQTSTSAPEYVEAIVRNRMALIG